MSIAEDAVTCPHCGTQLPLGWSVSIQQEVAKSPPSRKDILQGLALLIFLIGVIVYVIVLFFKWAANLGPGVCGDAGWVGGEWVHELYAMCIKNNR